MPVRETFGLVPAWAEPVLYLVFLPFAVVFAYGLYRRFAGSSWVALVRRSPSGAPGAIARLCREGLLQRRVARRARGWPHLAIFSGFLVLLFGTLVVALDWDVFRPLGVRLLQGLPYLWLELLLDLFGLIFVVGLVAALAWRFLRLRAAGSDQRRVQLEFVSLILVLLFMGVSGFALEALRLAIDPVPWAEWSFVGARPAGLVPQLVSLEQAASVYLVLWWTHAVVAFALIAALPYTVFLHSVGAPLNIMAQSGRPRPALSAPFDLRQLLESGDFDVRPGVARLGELAPEQRLALAACTNCGRCDEVCPAFAAGTELSPRRLVQTLRAAALERDTETDLLTEGRVSPGELWACTTCAACVEACPVLIAPVDYIVPFRRELVSRQSLDKRQSELLGNLGRSQNPYGLPAAKRGELATELAEAAHAARTR